MVDEPTLTLEILGDAPEDLLRAYLVVRDLDVTHVVEIEDGAELVLGRAPDVDVVLADTRVSRRHELCRDGTCERCATLRTGQAIGVCDKPHVCIHFDYDAKNCGGCGNVCGPSLRCSRGRCVARHSE
jgi:Stigma-specific protein, Stig1